MPAEVRSQRAGICANASRKQRRRRSARCRAKYNIPNRMLPGEWRESRPEGLTRRGCLASFFPGRPSQRSSVLPPETYIRLADGFLRPPTVLGLLSDFWRFPFLTLAHRCYPVQQICLLRRSHPPASNSRLYSGARRGLLASPGATAPTPNQKKSKRKKEVTERKNIFHLESTHV